MLWGSLIPSWSFSSSASYLTDRDHSFYYNSVVGVIYWQLKFYFDHIHVCLAISEAKQLDWEWEWGSYENSALFGAFASIDTTHCLNKTLVIFNSYLVHAAHGLLFFSSNITFLFAILLWKFLELCCRLVRYWLC